MHFKESVQVPRSQWWNDAVQTTILSLKTHYNDED